MEHRAHRGTHAGRRPGVRQGILPGRSRCGWVQLRRARAGRRVAHRYGPPVRVFRRDARRRLAPPASRPAARLRTRASARATGGLGHAPRASVPCRRPAGAAAARPGRATAARGRRPVRGPGVRDLDLQAARLVLRAGALEPHARRPRRPGHAGLPRGTDCVRAAVTGAGGFIGSALTSLLLDRGCDVAALDLPRALGRVPAGARRIGLDIRNQSALREALRGVQVLFHTAALFDLAAAWADLYAVNVEGVGQVRAASRARRIERVITWSSSSVYGGTARPEPLAETAPVPFERLNPYARSKWLGELLAREAAITDGLDVIVVRPAEVYGPGSAKGLGPALFAFKTGAMSAVPGPGKVRHSYVHVDDVARAAVHLAEHGASNAVYNLASPTPIAAADVYALARRRLGWLSLRDARVTLPHRPRLRGRPLFHVPPTILRLYARWEMLRARHGWLAGKFGPAPLANPAGVHLLIHNHVVDGRKLLETGFELAWPDTEAGILATLDAYERSGWAPFYASPRVSALPSGSPSRLNRPASAS